jgi:putative transposase
MGISGQEVREIFEGALPDELIQEMARATGFVQRERKRDVVRLVRAMVIAASTGYGGRQADVLRLYVENGGKEVVRGGFYSWFGPALEKTMEAVATRMLDIMKRQATDLPGVLGSHVQDWHIVDSTTVQLDDELKNVYPGTGDFAAVKVHKRLSVGRGTLWGYHLSPARDHDSVHLQVDESWRGLGLLVDLGYASLKLIGDCDRFGVHFVIRLKDNWKPRVDSVSRGTIAKTFFSGTDLDVLLDQDVLLLDGTAIDARVSIGRGERAVTCRLIGIPVIDGAYRFYLTSLPGRVGPLQIGDLYRVRWEIESDNKLDKSCSHLDEIGARTAPAARALIHASLVSSMLACAIVHRHRLNDVPPPGANAQRTTPPLHPQTLARAMGSAAMSIAAALELSGAEADREWQRIARYLSHLGFDPNWRRRPSVLDQMRGWKIAPARRRAEKRSAERAAN